jgi:iron complex transport system substrate-binding protein
MKFNCLTRNAVLLGLLLVVVLVGRLLPPKTADVSPPPAQPSSSAAAVLQPADDKTTQDTSYPATFADHMGRAVTLEKVPERIVSFSPANTELLFALGLGERVVGVTENCNYPDGVLSLPKVGGFAKPSAEAAAALSPDLVVGGNKHTEQAEALLQLGIPTLIIAPESLDALYDEMATLGEACNVQANAARVVDEMRSRIEAVAQKSSGLGVDARPRVYYEVAYDPLMSVGSVTLVHEAIELAGGSNIFGDINDRYPKISQEVLIERNPQIILFPQSHGSMDFDAQSIADRPLWAGMDAVVDGRIFQISGDLLTRAGPRLAEAIEQLNEFFYPTCGPTTDAKS